MSDIATFTTSLGTKRWGVSSKSIKDLTSLSTGYELKMESNSTVEGLPLTNERGLKPRSLSFGSNLFAYAGIDVREEIESWEPWVGQTGILKIGGRTFGPNWLLNKVQLSNVQLDSSGRFIFASLTFSFEENDEELDSSIVTAANETNAQSAVGVSCSSADKARLKAKNPALSNAAG